MNKESASILTIVFSLSFFALCIGAPAAEGSMPTEGLIGHWAFDEGAGDTVYDSVGANHGDIYGAQWTTGRVGGGLSFDGIDDWVEVADTVNNRPGTSDWSVALWFLAPDENQNAALISKREPSRPHNQFNLIIGDNTRPNNPGRTLEGIIVGIEAHTDVWWYCTPDVVDGSWHHAVLTRNQTGGEIYIDGVLQSLSKIIDSDTGPQDIDNTIPWGIGHSFNSVRYFKGIIDEVYIFNKAISAAEVEQLYQAGVGGPIAHWKFDEGEGDIAYDSVGANHGDIYGAQWTTGRVGGGLSFDGIDDWVEAADTVNNRPGTSDWSVALWFSAPNEAQTGPLITKKYPSYPHNQFGLYIGDDTPQRIAGKKLAAATVGTDPDTDAWRYCTPDVVDGSWHHAVFSRNQTGGEIYIDGVLQSLTKIIDSDTEPQNIDNTMPWSIGHNMVPAPGRYFKGIIDEVYIFNRAISSEEVEELYQAGAGAPPELIDLAITGPDEVPDSYSEAYSAIAYYEDSSTADVTTEAIWVVEPDVFANIDENGLLSTEQLYTPEEIVWISAQYTEDEITVDAEKQVVIFANCSTEELIKRNISGAVEIKEDILGQLETALDKERAAQDMLRDMQQSRDTGQWSFLQVVKARVRVVWAIIKEMLAKRKIEDSKDNLEDSLEILNSDDSQPAPPPNNGRRRRPGWQRQGR